MAVKRNITVITKATFKLDFFLLSMMLCVSVTLGAVDRHLSTNEGNEVSEYCIGEDFQPRCTGNDVIVMLSARYGRMKVGRCVQVDPGLEAILEDPKYLGCSKDVLGIVSTECSGKSQCQLRVSDQTFDNVESCYTGMMKYLQAAYMCVDVAAESRYCTVSVSSSPQHIVDFGRTRQHSEALGSRCGDRSRPWTVDALTGQRIVVSLIDFTTSNTAASVASTLTSSAHRDDVSGCDMTYGDVIDRAGKKNVSICRRAVQGGGLSRVYVSQSNLLQILFTPAASTEQHNFIVHVQAIGCSDLVAPSEGAWLRRDGDDVVVGCYMSRQTWQLRCVDGVWTGTVGLCPKHHFQSDIEAVASSSGGEKQPIQSQTFGFADSNFATLSIVAVSFSGLALCLIVICVGVACLRRQNRPLKGEKLTAADVERLKPLNGSTDSQSVNLSATTDDVNLQWDQLQRQQLVM